MNEMNPTQAEWKSPRKIQEEIDAAYKERAQELFESYMQTADEGLITRALAIAALRDDLHYPSA